MYTKNELMFPTYAIPRLRDARGEAWRNLVDRLASLPDTHEEVLAFMLMMVRFNGCLSCETDSYRAMRGCTMCARQTLRRYKGSENDLINMYRQALEDVQRYLDQPGPVVVHAELVAEIV
ncbi:MAG: hypothetical protein JXJ20_09455 [Anaerolineae bacterium]|jgi:hypothetical protein|nr:hypothetical protein [Anaerolineae bacterium]